MNVYTFLKITNMNMNILDYENKQFFYYSRSLNYWLKMLQNFSVKVLFSSCNNIFIIQPKKKKNQI